MLRVRKAGIILLLTGLAQSPAARAVTVELPFDREQAVRDYAGQPLRYAAPIAYPLDLRASGIRAQLGDRIVWTHEIYVPGASSLGLHAEVAQLPMNAMLWLGEREHGSQHISASGLWSETLPGERLQLRLELPRADADNWSLVLSSIYAGFRQIPKLQEKTRHKNNGCTPRNFSCENNLDLRDAGRAVVSFSIQNSFLCTATLVNNGAGDFRPLMLSASHCFGDLGGDFAASTVVVYWNALSDCNAALGNASNLATASQSGAEHLAQADETWVFALNEQPPPRAFPYWLGFDASDTEQQAAARGIHHGAGDAKQFSDYTVPAKATLNGTSLGALGPRQVPGWSVRAVNGEAPGGASGHSLLDNNLRTIGTHFGGTTDCDTGSSNSPGESFMRLAHAWDGPVLPGPNVAQFLNPASSNRIVAGSYQPQRVAPPDVRITATPAQPQAGEQVRLDWSSTGFILRCEAFGAWSGEQNPNGQAEIVVDDPQTPTGLRCFSEGDQPGVGSLNFAPTPSPTPTAMPTTTPAPTAGPSPTPSSSPSSTPAPVSSPSPAPSVSSTPAPTATPPMTSPTAAATPQPSSDGGGSSGAAPLWWVLLLTGLGLRRRLNSRP